MRRRLLIALSLALSAAFAQEFGGSYTGSSGAGNVVLELTQQGDRLTGTLSGPGIHFELEGFVYPDEVVAAGAAYTAEGMVGFEAYLQDDTLGLYVFELDAEGEPMAASAVELLLIRQSGASMVDPPRAPTGANPLTAADPLLGNFSDGALSVQVEGGGGQYSGRLEFGVQSYPFTATGSGQTMTGSFQSGGQAFTFSGSLQGGTLQFSTGGVTYALARVTPPAQDNPLAGSRTDPLLVRGSHANLHRDDALAFTEALEFALSQVGYAYRFTDAEREELLTAMAQAFPRAAPTDQAVLAQARDVWTRVQVHWPHASEAEQREFVLGVFVLAFGEETVQQWVGPMGAGGQGQALGAGPCTTFEECTSQFVDERTWTDTFNSQGCWAAAGCESYDSSSGTFTYSDDY